MNGQESEIRTRMASLDICEENVESECPVSAPKEETVARGYVLRKRSPQTYTTGSKRRCTQKPTKLAEEDHSVTDNCKYKFSGRQLETIYEEPLVMKNGNIRYMGSSKTRKLQFSVVTKVKLKQRKSRSKKLRSSKLRIQRKLNMDEFIARFHELMKSKETLTDDEKSD